MLPLLYRLMKFPVTKKLFTERSKDQLTTIINLLKIGLKFYSRKKIHVSLVPTSHVVDMLNYYFQNTSSNTLDSFYFGRKEAIERTIVKDKSQLPTIDDIVGQIEVTFIFKHYFNCLPISQ